MREAIHTASDFHIDISIFGELGGKVLLLYEAVGEVSEVDAHVLKAGHRSV